MSDTKAGRAGLRWIAAPDDRYAVTCSGKKSLFVSFSVLPLSMSDDKNKISNELIYKTLKEVQDRISIIDGNVKINSGKLSAIENILAGFHQSLHIRDQELDQHRGRLEALEGDVKNLKGDDPKP